MSSTIKKRKARGKAVKAEPLGYCLSLEYAMAQLYGMDGHWYGTAGSFHSPTRVRAAVRAAAKAIRRRVEGIATADDRLRLVVNSTLNSLEQSASDISNNGAGLLEVVAHLIDLAAILVGFDWMSGKPNREVIYHQTSEQQLVDDRRRHPPKTSEEWMLDFAERKQLVIALHAKGLRAAQIARVMNQPESRIKDILVRAGCVTRRHNVKAT
jgi:hypothetical protein